MDADKSILERGKLKPVQDLCGRWEIVDSEDDTYEVIHGRLPVKENRYLTKEQTQEVCNIVNYFKDKRNGFLETLKGIRDMADATKDAIPKEFHAAIDLLLILIDKRITEYTWEAAK